MTKVVQVLLGKGHAKVDARSDEQTTPLLFAADHGRIRAVKTLLEHHADIEAKNDQGETSLMCASKKGHYEVVRLLLEKGADRECPARRATKHPSWEPRRNGHTRVVQLLVEKGSDVNAGTTRGKTALMFAAEKRTPSRSQPLVGKKKWK